MMRIMLKNTENLKNTAPSPLSQIPSGVWILGFVSMLMDISSEMTRSLLPMYMVSVLGASVFTVGLIEGLAEATALMVRVFSGTLSDYLGKRKTVAFVGYALGALTKPFFALSMGLEWIIAARLMDRVGKGIRSAPRDALIADITPRHLRGAAFGLRQSLDTVGAFTGPLLAVGLMVVWANDFRAIFWVAVLPAALSAILFWIGVQEPEPAPSEKRVNPIRRDTMRRLDARYWQVVVIGAMFALARFSEAFLVLRAQQSGIAMSLVPLVMVAMSVVYAACAYPFGILSDKMRHSTLLMGGLVVLIAADWVLALAQGWIMVLLGVVLWGIHMGMTQGLLANMVANAAPSDLRGTAYGVFNLVSGIAMLVASGLAGWLWDRYGAEVTFLAGSGFAMLTFVALWVQLGKKSP